MSQRKNHRSEPKAFWEEHVRKCQGSGLAIKEYCRRHDLREGAFFYWKRKLGVSALKAHGLVELKLPLSSPTPVEIILRNEIRLRLAYSCDTEMVLKLSRELERL